MESYEIHKAREGREGGEQNKWNEQKTLRNMVDICPTIPNLMV